MTEARESTSHAYIYFDFQFIDQLFKDFTPLLVIPKMTIIHVHVLRFLLILEWMNNTVLVSNLMVNLDPPFPLVPAYNYVYSYHPHSSTHPPESRYNKAVLRKTMTTPSHFHGTYPMSGFV